MLEDLDPNIIIPSLFVLIGTVWAAKIGVQAYREKRGGTEAEERAYHETSTPISPGHDDGKVAGLVSLANEIGVLSAKVKEHSAELGKVKSELSMFRRSYNALYGGYKRIRTDWPTIRHQENPPDWPPDVHHP